MNKFEQVHVVVCVGGVGVGSHVVGTAEVGADPPVKQTDMIENITFPK